MGRMRDIVNKADASKEVAEEVKENLKTLFELSQLKAEAFLSVYGPAHQPPGRKTA